MDNSLQTALQEAGRNITRLEKLALLLEFASIDCCMTNTKGHGMKQVIDAADTMRDLLTLAVKRRFLNEELLKNARQACAIYQETLKKYKEAQIAKGPKQGALI